MDLWNVRQLLRLRRIRDWSKECRDGRKARFTPLDTVRYDLEQQIGFEEFILALSSCWVLSYQISYESAAKETPFPDIAVLGKYQNKHNNKNYLFKSKILFTPRVYKKKADEFGNLWMRNCRTVYFLSWWGRTTQVSCATTIHQGQSPELSLFGGHLVTYGLFECQLFPTHTLNDDPFPLDLFSKPSLLLTKTFDAMSPVGVLVLPVAM